MSTQLWSTIVVYDVAPYFGLRPGSAVRACPHNPARVRLDSPQTSLSGAAPAPAIATPARVTLRALASIAECRMCVALQQEIWGSDYGELVPASVLRVAAHVGGMAAGAFTDGDELVGFVFGITGLRNGAIVHWSHALGVRESARNAGVGRLLKQFQRAELARRGIATILWTFDPLMAKNAHLNLNRLGVRVLEYVRDMYGATRSPLHHGLATDRLLVEWPTTPDPMTSAGAAHASAAATTNGGSPLLTAEPRTGDVLHAIESNERPPVLRIEVPADVRALLSLDPGVGAAWQAALRRHLEWALGSGYAVLALHRDAASGRAFYELARAPSAF